jgi:hypothetical protein
MCLRLPVLGWVSFARRVPVRSVVNNWRAGGNQRSSDNWRQIPHPGAVSPAGF